MSKEKLGQLIDELNKLVNGEEWSSVIAKCDEIISLLPASDMRTAEAFNMRGSSKGRLGDHAGAINDCNQALLINPQFADAFSNRAVAKSSRGDHEGALNDFGRALSINPKLVEAYSGRGVAQNRKGDHASAIPDFDMAIQLNSQYANAYVGRGNAKTGMGNYADALADYNQAIELNPQDADTYYNRGNAKMYMSDFAGSIADFDKAIDINPQFVEAYDNRGIAKGRMGNHAEAVADHERALKINPEHKNAIHNRAAALAETQYQAQLQKHQKEFEARLAARMNIIESSEYERSLEEYGRKARWRGGFVWGLAVVLAAAAAGVFGGIAYLGFEQWQKCESPCKIEGSSALSLLPFILMGTMVLSPLVWIIRMLNRDKHKYWALREDANTNLTLMRIIEVNPKTRENLWARLFDHHASRGSVHPMTTWDRADKGGGNSLVSVQDIINRLKPGDKGGDS